jgi:hypothetical protein
VQTQQAVVRTTTGRDVLAGDTRQTMTASSSARTLRQSANLKASLEIQS